MVLRPLIVATGSPGNWNCVTSAQGVTTFAATAGTQYTILAFAEDDGLPGSKGGCLRIGIDPAPPPPTIDVSVDKFAGFDSRTGTATVNGTAAC